MKNIKQVVDFWNFEITFQDRSQLDRRKDIVKNLGQDLERVTLSYNGIRLAR